MLRRLATLTVIAVAVVMCSPSNGVFAVEPSSAKDSPLALSNPATTPPTADAQRQATAGKAHPKVITAPLPPAFWPGIYALSAMGALEAARRARAKFARTATKG